MEAGNVAVARTEHGRAIEQRLRFDLASVPEQVESLREICLRKAWIELQGNIDRRQRLVILMGHAQDPSERAVTETIESIERDCMTPLAQRRFQPRRAIVRIVKEGALQIDVAESAMAGRKIRICCDSALKIGFGQVEPRRSKSP